VSDLLLLTTQNKLAGFNETKKITWKIKSFGKVLLPCRMINNLFD